MMKIIKTYIYEISLNNFIIYKASHIIFEHP